MPDPARNPFGLIGLAVMGQNLVLNIESRGFAVSVFNRSTDVTEAFVGAHPGKRLTATKTLAQFVESLARPRKVMLMVKAGAPVDSVLEQLAPLLEPGDIVVDGGNSHFADTERRGAALAARGLHFVGCGVSGGEEGARKGPSIMPGGPVAAWRELQPVFERIAAKAGPNRDEPCVVHIGEGGAGHYVKMVHNGIEYGDMQLICEAYALMQAAGMAPAAMADVFAQWNEGELQSYLIEITSHILRQRDTDTGGPLVDVILDKAGQKGTGQWTLASAADNAVVVSTINAAVEARVLSSMKAARVAASERLSGPPRRITLDAKTLVPRLHEALYASKIVSYAQGLDLMRTMGEKKGWQLDLGGIAAIWRGGCIIRARFLEHITEAYRRAPHAANEGATVQGAPREAPANLMLAPFFERVLNRAQGAWREVVALAVTAGVPVPATSASLAYYDAYRSARLPANLLQAQRDFFGAHTYERVDRPAGEFFHTQWPEVIG